MYPHGCERGAHPAAHLRALVPHPPLTTCIPEEEPDARGLLPFRRGDLGHVEDKHPSPVSSSLLPPGKVPDSCPAAHLGSLHPCTQPRAPLASCPLCGIGSKQGEAGWLHAAIGPRASVPPPPPPRSLGSSLPAPAVPVGAGHLTGPAAGVRGWTQAHPPSPLFQPRCVPGLRLCSPYPETQTAPGPACSGPVCS